MKRLLAVLFAMTVIALGVFFALREPEPTSAGSAIPAGTPVERIATPAISQRAPVEAGTAAPARSAETAAPTWMLPATRPEPAAPGAPSTAPGGMQDKIARLNAVLQKLNQLQAQPDIDVTSASAAIAELEQINGSPVMNGVRLDVLRENMKIADRIQTVAAELQRLQKSTTAASPEQTALVQSKTAELVALQSRIRHDIMQAPDGAGGGRP